MRRLDSKALDELRVELRLKYDNLKNDIKSSVGTLNELTRQSKEVSKSFNKDIRVMQDRIAALKKSIISAGAQEKVLVQQMAPYARIINDMRDLYKNKKGFEGLSERELDEKLSSMHEKYARAIEKINRLSEKVEPISLNKIVKMKELEKLTNSLAEQKAELNAIMENYRAKIDETQNSINNQKLSLNLLKAEIEKKTIEYKEAVRAEREALKESKKTIGVNKNKLNVLNRLKKTVADITGRIRRFGIENNNSGRRTLTFAERVKSAFKMVTRRIFIIEVIRKSIKAVIRYLKGILGTNDRLVKSLNSVRTNLIVAFQPLISFVIPLLETLMIKLVSATRVMAEFMSKLFGTTYKDSLKAAQGIEKTKKEMEGLNKAGKNLQSFDEVNLLDTDNEKSKFKLEFEDTEELSWIDGVVSKLESIANKIKDVLRPLIEFTVDIGKGIYENVLKPISNISFGGLENILGILKETIEGINFDKIKTSLEGVYEPIVKVFDKITSGVGTVIEGVLAPALLWISNEFLPRFIDGISKFLESINFDKLTEHFNNLLESIKPFGSTVGDTLLWFIDEVLQPLSTWVVNELLPPFIDLLAAAIDVLNESLKALKPLLQFLIDNIFPIIGDLVIVILKELTEILKGLAKFISENTATVQALVAGLLAFKTVSFIVTLFEGIKNTMIAVKAAFVGAKAAISATAATFAGISVPISAVIALIVANIVVWINIFKKLPDVVDDVVWIFKASVIKIKEFFSDIVGNTLEFGKKFIESMLSPFNKIKEGILEFIKGSKDWGKNMLEGFIEGITFMLNPLKNTIKKITGIIKDFLGFASPTKLGPGAESDKWAPNLMKMLSEGIDKNIYRVEASVSNTAEVLAKIIPQSDKTASAVGTAMLGAMQFNQGQGNGELQDIKLELDGTVFARLIRKYTEEENRRLGLEVR